MRIQYCTLHQWWRWNWNWWWSRRRWMTARTEWSYLLPRLMCILRMMDWRMWLKPTFIPEQTNHIKGTCRNSICNKNLCLVWYSPWTLLGNSKVGMTSIVSTCQVGAQHGQQGKGTWNDGQRIGALQYNNPDFNSLKHAMCGNVKPGLQTTWLIQRVDGMAKQTNKTFWRTCDSHQVWHLFNQTMKLRDPRSRSMSRAQEWFLLRADW